MEQNNNAAPNGRIYKRTGPEGMKIAAPAACHKFMTEYTRQQALGGTRETIQILTEHSNPELPEMFRLEPVGVGDVALAGAGSATQSAS
jgi:hypothetical protein